MTLTSNYIRTEGNGRLRCYRTPAVASRQLEASIGTLVIMLMIGFVAAISQHGPSRAIERTAEPGASRPAIVRTGVRVIPMTAPQAAVLLTNVHGSL